MKHRYPPEIYDFVIKNVKTMTDAELVAYVENRVKKAHSEGFNKGRKLVKQEGARWE